MRGAFATDAAAAAVAAGAGRAGGGAVGGAADVAAVRDRALTSLREKKSNKVAYIASICECLELKCSDQI